MAYIGRPHLSLSGIDPGLDSISDLTTAADKMIYTTGSDVYAVTTITSAARGLLDDASVGDMRTTLGLGDVSTKTVGIGTGNVGTFAASVADNDFLKIDGTTIEGRDAGQVLSDIGGAALAGATFTGAISGTNVTLTGYLRGPASFTIDPASHGDNTGTVVIAGNLQVDGTTTTINSTTVAIDDLNFSIATDAADSAAANGAGISVGGAGATMLYTHATTSWDFNKPVNITGGADASTFFRSPNFYTGVGSQGLNNHNTNDLKLVAQSADTHINMVNNGAVELYHDNSKKIETTSSGIDVTGGIVADHHVNIGTGMSFQWGDSHERIEQSDGKIEFFTGNSEKMTLSGSNLGIGTTAPTRNLTVSSSSQTDLAIIAGTSSSSQLCFGDSGDDNIGQIEYANSTNHMAFYTNATEVLRITNDGALTVKPNGITTGLRLQGRSGDHGFYIQFKNNNGSTNYASIGQSGASQLNYWADAHVWANEASSTERMRITGDGVLRLSNSIEEQSTAGALSNSNQTLTLDLHASNNFTVTTAAAITSFVVSNATSGQANYFTLKVAYGGSHAITWGSSVKWAAATAPTLSTSGTDIFVFYTIDGGSTIYGFTAGQALA